MKVAVCTPTRNRRWAWAFSKACMDTQTLQPDVWIIVDNTPVHGQDWSVCLEETRPILYEREYIPRTIGWLRNRCVEIALREGADYIVFWDDDDYYPPNRICKSIRALEDNPQADIAGSTLMYILLTRENVLMTTGPFHNQHCTAATMVIRRRYAETHRFDPTREKAEEVTFTNNWSANVVQLQPEDVIVVMGHAQNTVDKSDLLRNPVRYNAKIVNDINGKMMFRTRWPVQWDLWKSTFFGEACVPLPSYTPLEEFQTVVVPILHTEDTVESGERRA